MKCNAFACLLIAAFVAACAGPASAPEAVEFSDTRWFGLVRSQSGGHFAVYLPDEGHLSGTVRVYRGVSGARENVWPIDTVEDLEPAARSAIAATTGVRLGEWRIEPYPYELWVLEREAAVLVTQGERPLPDREWLSLIEASGRCRWRRNAEDFFGVLGDFEFGIHRLGWLDHIEIHEERGTAVVVGRGGHRRTIRLATGKIEDETK